MKKYYAKFQTHFRGTKLQFRQHQHTLKTKQYVNVIGEFFIELKQPCSNYFRFIIGAKLNSFSMNKAIQIEFMFIAFGDFLTDKLFFILENYLSVL